MGSWGIIIMRALSSSSSSPSSAIVTALMLQCFIIGVSSKPPSTTSVGVGYEYVTTVYPNQETGNWEAPCFLQNTAILQRVVVDDEHFLYTVIVTPHNGNCWTCRDDYQMKLGDKILASCSTYFGAFHNKFVLSYNDDDVSRIENEGVDIYVDKNAACGNGLSMEAMKNPFKRAVESIAMN